MEEIGHLLNQFQVEHLSNYSGSHHVFPALCIYNVVVSVHFSWVYHALMYAYMHACMLTVGSAIVCSLLLVVAGTDKNNSIMSHHDHHAGA